MKTVARFCLIVVGLAVAAAVAGELMFKGSIFSYQLCEDQESCITSYRKASGEAERQRELDEDNARDMLRRMSVMAVRVRMREMASAEFRDVFNSKRKRSVVCGYVNGKNAKGAFTGFKEFIVDSEVHFNDGSSEFARHWNYWCSG